ncbi:hypothetical protein KC19_4G045800 [Ceratodon purpureus]|uniref:Uncharacterized protein n=1 Tax=Ceratodon purpureus TaxID=3225 RepID=A0A8T0I546_CERPU|nr:hypothetical protein KC19_4G045800 [Ceratodon purpureus]
MMVIDSVHSSGVSRMHAGQIRRMKIVRPLHSLEGFEANIPILASLSTVEEKSNTGAGNLERRQSLVIRRRIMVPQLEENDDAGFHQLTPALLNQSNSSTTTTSLNYFQEKKSMDHSTVQYHIDVVLPRSSPSTKDQVCDSSAAIMTKPPKKIHLFDLNKLPTSPDGLNPVESPTSTIASADSTTHVNTNAAPIPVMATDMTFFSDSSPSIVKTFTDVEGDAHRGGARLAVDLGLLPPTSPETTRRHNIEGLSMQTQCTDLPTPARKRLRKLSEYAGAHGSTSLDTSIGKSETTDGGEVCIRRDVTKTLALPEPKTKVLTKVVVDDEIWAAACVLMTLSWSRKRRRVSSIAEGSRVFLDEEEGGGAGPSSPCGSDLAASETTSSRSLGSGGSVLLRPSNKQRYRSVGELMAQTSTLKRV